MSQQYGFTKENKGAVDAALDFPRLKAEKKGEKIRLAIFGMQTVDGKPALSMPQPDGGYYFGLRIPGHEREFVGSYECLADEAAKREGDYDADACPHCKYVLSGTVSEEVLQPRKRRFVLPVIVYKTQPGTSELVVPHSVEAKAWRFTDRYFNVLVDEHEKWEASKGLLGHDVTLTCEGVQFQNFTVSVEPDAAYQKDRDLGKLVIQTFLNQTASLPEGLGRQLGSKLNAVDLERKITETIEAAAQLGIGGPQAVPQVDPATIESLATDLLGAPATEAAEVPEAAPAAAEVAAEVPTAEPAAAPVEAGADAVDFDEFFGGTG